MSVTVKRDGQEIGALHLSGIPLSKMHTKKLREQMRGQQSGIF